MKRTTREGQKRERVYARLFEVEPQGMTYRGGSGSRIRTFHRMVGGIKLLDEYENVEWGVVSINKRRLRVYRRTDSLDRSWSTTFESVRRYAKLRKR